MRVILEVSDASSAALIERFAARLGEIQDATLAAPSGEAVAVCEEAAIEALFCCGRETIATALAARAAAAEKKSRRAAGAAASSRTAKGRGRGD